MNNAKLNDKAFHALAYTVFLISISYCGFSYAAVTGNCVNCHTMHDSQDGGPIALDGAGVGWNDVDQLAGGTTQGPMSQLLVTSCVGCHTSTTASTIIEVGESRIPIVYNTVVPTNPLAGGNFYWVAQDPTNDAYGHNVMGISAPDSVLDEAPGRQSATCGGSGAGNASCHMSLAEPSNHFEEQTGCQGCHMYTAHHDDSKPWYRFLIGHFDDYYVEGIEDPDWEQNPASGHNMYQGYEGPVADTGYTLLDTHSISSFCGGCHAVFHRVSVGGSDPEGIGSASPWLRHPTDITLWDKGGEYQGYDTVGDYSAEAPVAWIDPASPSLDSAVVMCLSCHRPHGSDQPDMLRWNYSSMIVGAGGSGGCFTCHTTKD